MKKYILILLFLSLCLAMFLSPFASTSPDGLEKVAEDKGFLDSAKGEEKFSAPLPDYTIPGISREGLSTSMAGFVGTIITFTAGIGLAFLLKKKRKITGENERK